MIRASAVLFTFSSVLTVAGCSRDSGDPGQDASAPRQGYHIYVVNSSDVRIYTTVVSGRAEEDFGVVAPKAHKSIGFGMFRLDKTVKVVWREGGFDDVPREHLFRVEPLLAAADQIVKLKFIYTAKQQWELRGYDKDDHEVGEANAQKGGNDT